MGRILTTVVVLGLIITASATDASGWYLAEIIPLSDVDILNIASDGTNIIVLSNTMGGPDTVKVFDTSGHPISPSFSVGSMYTSGITWNGQKAVFAKGKEAEWNGLYEMDLGTGSVSGPFTPNFKWVDGLGFDGTNIVVSHQPGTFTLLDASTYANMGMISLEGVTLATGLACHNGDLFVTPFGENKVYHYDAELNLVEQISLVTPYTALGIGFVGEDFYIGDRGTEALYRYVVPEPATILLLGLGGLFLRRRKKNEKQTYYNVGDISGYFTNN